MGNRLSLTQLRYIFSSETSELFVYCTVFVKLRAVKSGVEHYTLSKTSRKGIFDRYMRCYQDKLLLLFLIYKLIINISKLYTTLYIYPYQASFYLM